MYVYIYYGRFLSFSDQMITVPTRRKQNRAQSRRSRLIDTNKIIKNIGIKDMESTKSGTDFQCNIKQLQKAW